MRGASLVLVLALPYVAIVWGVAIALALAASILLHELANAALAARYGRRPRREALVALGGPVTSFAAGMVSGAAATFVPRGDVHALLVAIAVLNVGICAFELLPGLPMDGGRILRALLARRRGRVRATAIAVTSGKICAVLLAIGAIGFLSPCAGLLAVFVYVGAAAEAAAAATTAALAPYAVSALLPHHEAAPVVPATLRLEEAAQCMADLDRTELVVTGLHGPLAILEADDVARLVRTRSRWSLAALASELPARFVVVGKAEPATAALDVAAQENAPYVVVVDPPETVVGLVTPGDVRRTLQLHRAAA